MKKNFVKPTLKRYELNTKENIVASITWNDGTMTSRWKFHQYDPENIQNEITGEEGCFDVLDRVFATNQTVLTYEGAWNDFVASLSVYNNPNSPYYQDPDYLNTWNNYKACKG